MKSWPIWKNVSRKWKASSSMRYAKWAILALVLVLFSCGGSEPKVVTVEISVDELICSDGVRIFEGRVLALQGIKAVTVNMNEHKAKVSFHDDQLDLAQVSDHLMEFGFTVDGKAGNQIARKRLPACCLRDAEE